MHLKVGRAWIWVDNVQICEFAAGEGVSGGNIRVVPERCGCRGCDGDEETERLDGSGDGFMSFENRCGGEGTGTLAILQI